MKKSRKIIIIIVSILLAGTAVFLVVLQLFNQNPLKKLTKDNVKSVELVRKSYDGYTNIENFRYELSDSERAETIKGINKLKFHKEEIAYSEDFNMVGGDGIRLKIITDNGEISVTVGKKYIIVVFGKNSLSKSFSESKLQHIANAETFKACLGKLNDKSFLNYNNLDNLIEEYIKEGKNEA